MSGRRCASGVGCCSQERNGEKGRVENAFVRFWRCRVYYLTTYTPNSSTTNPTPVLLKHALKHGWVASGSSSFGLEGRPGPSVLLSYPLRNRSRLYFRWKSRADCDTLKCFISRPSGFYSRFQCHYRKGCRGGSLRAVLFSSAKRYGGPH